MSPWNLVKTNSESAHQKAIFAWVNVAKRFGEQAAWDAHCYRVTKVDGADQPGLVYAEKWYGTTSALRMLDDLLAVPNGGKRDQKTAARLKAEGVKRGVSDMFLPWNNGFFAGFWIELKPNETKKLTVEQQSFLNRMRANGFRAQKTVGWLETVNALIDYVGARR